MAESGVIHLVQFGEEEEEDSGPGIRMGLTTHSQEVFYHLNTQRYKPSLYFVP